MGKFDDLPETRRRGLERMEQVYGFEMTDGTGDFFGYTADHLFADIWNRPGLTDRDRRLILIGMLAGSNQHDVLTIQIPAAYASGELDDVAAARDRDLAVPLRRLAERLAGEPDRRGDHREGRPGDARLGRVSRVGAPAGLARPGPTT